MYISIGQASKFFGISISTFRRWEGCGVLKPSFRTPGGHRRYHLEELNQLFLKIDPKSSSDNRNVYAYARVSSSDQKPDLERQKERLGSFCQSLDPNYILLDDLGSGMNYKKRGLNNLIKAICNRQISTLVLTHKDRLLRFGSAILFKLCDMFGTTVIIIEKQLDKSFEQELVADVIEIMTVFTARIHGKRSHRHKKAA